jgi:hypothetical protein
MHRNTLIRGLPFPPGTDEIAINQTKVSRNHLVPFSSLNWFFVCYFDISTSSHILKLAYYLQVADWTRTICSPDVGYRSKHVLQEWHDCISIVSEFSAWRGCCVCCAVIICVVVVSNN